MRSLRISAVPCVFSLLALGCSDQVPPTAATTSPTAPIFNFTNGPESPGPIMRISFPPEAGFRILFFDQERLLLALLSQNNSLLGCNPDAITFESVDRQVIFNPVGPVMFLDQAADHFTTVYDVRGLPPLDCDLLTGASGRMLARGFTDVVLRDNDVFVSGTRTNAFGVNANGRLDNLVAGGKLAFRLHFQAEINKSDDSFRVFVDDIKLSPDPRF